MERDMNLSSNVYKIPMQSIINLADYAKYRNFLECYLCHYLAINPYFCENCNNSFCKNCIDTLKIDNDKCPVCTLENSDLRVSNDKFNDFFKDLMIKCDTCNEQVTFPFLTIHKCFKQSKPHSLEDHLVDKEKYKLIDSTIYVKCDKCKEWIANNLMSTHMITCPVSPQNFSLFNPSSISPNLNSGLCGFCFKQINQNDLINHLTECPEFIRKIAFTDKSKILLGISSNIPGTTTNVLEVMENFKKITQTLDTNNIQLLVSTINSLEKTIVNFEKNTCASYCKNCKSVNKIFELVLCKCCDKKFCVNCCVPCTNCDGIVSSKCLFTCQNCKGLKCPLCEIQIVSFCMCLDHKICKACFTNPNITNLSIALLKGAHVNCSYFKLLENNIYVAKIPKFDFRAEISLNSIKQATSISLIKNGVEMFSRIFQININEKFIIQLEKTQFKVGSSIDYWFIDTTSMEGGLDYMIINFNANPNYSYVLNKFNSTNFEQMTNSTTGVTGMYGMFNIGKPLIGNIIFQKI